MFGKQLYICKKNNLEKFNTVQVVEELLTWLSSNFITCILLKNLTCKEKNILTIIFLYLNYKKNWRCFCSLMLGKKLSLENNNLEDFTIIQSYGRIFDLINLNFSSLFFKKKT